MRPFLLIPLLASLCVCASATVRQQTTTFDANDFSVTFGDDDPTSATFTPSLVGTFEQFDPTLGTLNSARFDYTISFDVTAIASLANETIQIGGGGQFVLGSTVVYGGGLSGDGSGLAVGDTISFSASITSGPEVPALSFSLVEGTESFSLGWYSTPLVLVRQQVETLGQIAASGSITVTYDYTPSASAVPEPSSYATLLGGAALAGVFLRRRPRLG